MVTTNTIKTSVDYMDSTSNKGNQSAQREQFKAEKATLKIKEDKITPIIPTLVQP
jgi:hypothetical protein